jgi:hypothetical protein
MSENLVTLIANVALSLSFIVALVFGIAQVHASNRDRHERFTLDTMRNFQTREFAELIHYTVSFDVPSTYEKWKTMPDKDQIAFIQMGQQMESLGLLVADKFVDMDLVDKTLGSFVTNTWNKYKALVIDMRIKTNDPYLNEYFQWLAENIDKRMKSQSRDPYYKTAPMA